MRLLSISSIVSFLRVLTVSLLIGAMFLGVIHAHVFAAYGEGSYGGGVYNTGSTSTGSTSSSSSSGNSSDAKAPGCDAQPPDSVPDLFQINAQPENLTLFFTPSSGNRDRYFVSYSTEPSAEQHGFEFMNNENGVIMAEVKALQPNTEYYFKVRAGNGCQPGEWSNVLLAKTGQRFPTYRWYSLPRVVTTAVTRRVNPSSVTKVEVQEDETDVRSGAPSPTPSAAPTQQQETTPTPQPAVDQGQEGAGSTSFFSRVMNFFKNLF